MAYDESKVTISSVLEANFAGGDGGGLASADESTIVIENGALFRKNYAVGNGGGVLAAGLSVTIGDLKSYVPYFAYFPPPLDYEGLSYMRICCDILCCVDIHDDQYC
jgi:predicted outer membrane repeat protein